MSERERFLGLLRRHGAEAVSFVGLESGMQHWFAEDGAAAVAYVDTGRAWVAAGLPVANATEVARAARAFVERARSHGRTACFFAAESCPREGFASMLLGEQPVWQPAEWPVTLAKHRRLREQLRRARAKGVRVRRVRADEVDPKAPLREQVEALGRRWLATRRMAPMGFLVALEPFHSPEEHRYFVAEHAGRVIAFLSAVPVYATRGWLVEDIVREPRAPNGTTEALLHALLHEVADAEFVTLGLAPLAGHVGPWLRVARLVARPLYDFRGLHAFKQRLRPARWRPVWLVFPHGDGPVTPLIESLRAFSGGPLLSFGARSVLAQPGAVPLALALPLVPWIVLLAGLVASGHARALGMSPGQLGAWVAFDCALSVALVASAWRPRPGRLALSTAAASTDAAYSLPHLFRVGLGGTLSRAVLRSLSALAPCLGALVLAWATFRAIERSRS
jgi:phosphatidylglycerol lysyltransferase